MSEPIRAGAHVECRTINGEWVRGVAASEARYDIDHAIDKRRGTFLSVAVWVPPYKHPINWPAEDVRHAGPGVPDDFADLNAFFAENTNNQKEGES